MPWRRWRVPGRDIRHRHWREIPGTKLAADRSGPKVAAPRQRERMECGSHREPMPEKHTRCNSTGQCHRICMWEAVSLVAHKDSSGSGHLFFGRAWYTQFHQEAGIRNPCCHISNDQNTWWLLQGGNIPRLPTVSQTATHRTLIGRPSGSYTRVKPPFQRTSVTMMHNLGHGTSTSSKRRL